MAGDVVPALRDVVHDLRSSLGSIRLVLTSVLDEESASIDDVRPLLNGAEQETRRLAAAMSAVTALAEATSDENPAIATDVGPVLDASVTDARRRDLDVTVSGSGGRALLRPSAPSVLGALWAVLDGGTGDLAVQISEDGLLVSRADGGVPRIDSAVVRHLLAAIDAHLEPDGDALRLRLPSA